MLNFRIDRRISVRHPAYSAVHELTRWVDGWERQYFVFREEIDGKRLNFQSTFVTLQLLSSGIIPLDWHGE